MKSKYLYVIYPAGCGGHHVCNMISLCDGFEQRVSNVKRPDYKKWLLNHYKKYNYLVKPHIYVNAHLARNMTHIDTWYEYVDKEYALNPTNTLIIHGHIINFRIASDNGILEELGSDFKAIVMSYPPKNSLPWQRIEAYGIHSPLQEYGLPLSFNDQSNKQTTLEVNENNGFYIDTVKFFTIEGSQYLRELLKNHFDVNLPIEADELHTAWSTWMEHVVDKKNIEYWDNNLNDKKYSDYLKKRKNFKSINIK